MVIPCVFLTRSSRCIKFECFDILTTHFSFFSYMFNVPVVDLFLEHASKAEEWAKLLLREQCSLVYSRITLLWRITSFSDLNHLMKKKIKWTWRFCPLQGVLCECLGSVFKSMAPGGVWLSLCSSPSQSRTSVGLWDAVSTQLLLSHCLLWKLWAGASISSEALQIQHTDTPTSVSTVHCTPFQAQF